ncbi:MAG: hypothetical protein AB7S26_28310 [Sandaracinaceae bacterium]
MNAASLRRALAYGLALSALFTVGCGPGFAMNLPDRFADLTRDPDVHDQRYGLRATTPDGVVLGVQRLDHHVDGSLTFWSEAVTRRLRDQQGYALLGEEDITAASGQTGHLMRFGRDLEGHAYRYTIALYVTPSHILLVEAGGREEAFQALETDIETSIRGMRM